MQMIFDFANTTVQFKQEIQSDFELSSPTVVVINKKSSSLTHLNQEGELSLVSNNS